MPRPEYLRRITRVPSWRWTVRKVTGRFLRRMRGIERPPVHVPTERELRLAELSLAFTAGACAMGVPLLLFLLYTWRPSCL